MRSAARVPIETLRTVCALLLALCCAAGCERSRATATAQAPPDVLLVTIDTLRADHLSAYGYARQTSPNLDRLAAQGALFEVAYAPSPATMPSHASLFTSRYPLAHGVVRNGIPLGDTLPTLPAMLAEQGYRTAAFVSSYPVSREFGLARGFAHFDDRLDRDRFAKRRRADGNRLQVTDRLGEHTVDAAIAWWTTQPDDAPRFAWVHLYDPHLPYAAPQPYGDAFRRAAPTPLEQRIDAYDGEILYTDAQLGRLLEASSEDAGARGLLTVVTADHGEAFGERGWQGHNRSVFEEEVRIPLVVCWPGVVRAGVRSSALAHLVDVLPTVAAATGLPAHDRSFAGIDLLPVIAGEAAADPQRTVYLQRPYYEDSPRARRRDMMGFGFGVRRGAWKYIEALEQDRRNLFDLDGDPGEASDLAPAHPDRATELSSRIASWREHELANAVVPAQVPAPRSQEVRRKLRALGYAD